MYFFFYISLSHYLCAWSRSGAYRGVIEGIGSTFQLVNASTGVTAADVAAAKANIASLCTCDL